MHRLGIAVAAAVVLSMAPVAPSASAAPLSAAATILDAGGDAFMDVGYRYRGYGKYKRRYRSGLGFYWYGGRRYYPRKKYRYGYGYPKYGYRRGYYGNCVRVGGVRVCF